MESFLGQFGEDVKAFCLSRRARSIDPRSTSGRIPYCSDERHDQFVHHRVRPKRFERIRSSYFLKLLFGKFAVAITPPSTTKE